MWFTPAVIMAMLASGASTPASMVCTGDDMISVTGAWRETWPTTTLLRRSTSVTMPWMPRPPGPRTRIAERFSLIRISAACRAVVSGSQNSGLLRVTDVTGSVRTSGVARMVPAACTSRSRESAAIHWMPAGRLRRSTAAARGRQYSSESSRARTVNSGASPVSSVGCPMTSPAATTAT